MIIVVEGGVTVDSAGLDKFAGILVLRYEATIGVAAIIGEEGTACVATGRSRGVEIKVLGDNVKVSDVDTDCMWLVLSSWTGGQRSAKQCSSPFKSSSGGGAMPNKTREA